MKIDFTTLYDLYITQGLSSDEIGKRHGINPRVIRSWLKSYQIPTHRASMPSRDELHALYVTQGMSRRDVADYFGVNQDTISRWLTKAGITIRRIQDLDARGIQKPTREELIDLYVTQRLTTRQIATHTKAAPTSIKNWLREYGIERRPANNGLLHRGVTEPTREELIDLIHVQHRSYDEVASMFGVDKTAVPYWLDKHHIAKPTYSDTALKGKKVPDKEMLESLYIGGQSLESIGNQYGVSEGTIQRLCKKYEIDIKLSGFDGGKRYQCKDGHLVRSIYEQQVDDWLHDQGIAHSYEPRLPFDNRSKADFFANGWYIEVWGITQNKEYTERRKRKVQGYKDHNLPLIELEVHYFDKARNQLWARRLKKVLEPPVTPLQLF